MEWLEWDPDNPVNVNKIGIIFVEHFSLLDDKDARAYLLYTLYKRTEQTGTQLINYFGGVATVERIKDCLNVQTGRQIFRNLNVNECDEELVMASSSILNLRLNDVLPLKISEKPKRENKQEILFGLDIATAKGINPSELPDPIEKGLQILADKRKKLRIYTLQDARSVRFDVNPIRCPQKNIRNIYQTLSPLESLFPPISRLET